MDDDYYEQRLKIHRNDFTRIMSKGLPSSWVSRAECERFTPEQKAEADVLFMKIGIDPDLYLDFARAQVVRVQ